MKANIRMKILVIYQLFLAAGAIWLGMEMVRSRNGIFSEYPHEWAARLPFHSWVIPGILAIAVFGIGNVTICKMSVKFHGLHQPLWADSFLPALYFKSPF